MLKLGLVIPDGVGVKNYLYSKFFSDLNAMSNVEVYIISHFNDSYIEYLLNHNIARKNQFIKLPPNKENRFSAALRILKSKVRLERNICLTENKTLRNNWNPKRKSIMRKVFVLFCKFVALFGKKSKVFISVLESLYTSTSYSKDDSRLISFFLKHDFDLILNTHQRAENVIQLFNVANRIKVKTACFIFSWDNIPKAKLNVKCENYFLWSNYMRDEFIKFYPDFAGKLFVSGSPQFEFYQQPFFEDDPDYLKLKYGLKENIKVVCFTGNDTRTSPNDPEYLRDLAECIKNSDLKDKISILFRPNPTDTSNRFVKVLEEFPDTILFTDPNWIGNKHSHWSEKLPSIDDMIELYHIIKYTDAGYNIGSTIAHDYATFNKPCFYINYDNLNENDWHIKTIYDYEHFKSLTVDNNIIWLASKAIIYATLKDWLKLNEKTKYSDDWFKKINTYPKTSSDLILGQILELCT